MAFHQIAVGVDFDMQGGKDLSRTVVVDDQIMDAQDAVIGKRHIADGIDKMRIRGFSQKRTHRFFDQTDTRPENKQCDETADIAVDLQGKKVIGQNTGQNGGSGNDVVAAVGSGGSQRQ